MIIGKALAECRALSIEADYTSHRPIPMTNHIEGMVPKLKPICGDVNYKSAKPEAYHISVLGNDRFALLLAVFGGKEGVGINIARVLPLPQTNAPAFRVLGVRADDGEVLYEGGFENILPGKTGYLIIEVTTNSNTPAGNYQTMIELNSHSCDEEFTQIPFMVHVGDFVLPEEIAADTACFETVGAALREPFAAFLEGRAPAMMKDDTMVGYCSSLTGKVYAMLSCLKKQEADALCRIVLATAQGEQDETVILRTRAAISKLLAKEVF